MRLSGKGSLGLALVLQGGDHAGLQAPFGDLQVTVQAVDQVDQQLLLQQLACSDLALQGERAVFVVECQLAAAIAVDVAEGGVVGVRASLSSLQILSIRNTRWQVDIWELTIEPVGKFALPARPTKHARAV